ELTYRLGHYPPREADVWLWQSEHYNCPVLISEAVQGKSFQEVLENDYILQLNPQSFGELVLITGLLSLEDNKPDNLMLLLTENGSRFCLIDSDRCFVLPFKGNRLNAKNAIFCLKQMATTIDPLFREELLSIHPQELLQAWVESLE